MLSQTIPQLKSAVASAVHSFRYIWKYYKRQARYGHYPAMVRCVIESRLVSYNISYQYLAAHAQSELDDLSCND